MKKAMYRISFFMLLCISCNTFNEEQDRAAAIDSLSTTVLRNFENFIANAWNNGNMDSLRSISSENYIKHLNGIQVASNQREMEANMNIYLTGFPDGEVKVGEITVANRRLFAKWQYTGTNTGTFGESAPTGKKVHISGHTNLEFNGEGKIVKEEVFYNELELLQQLGYTLTPPNLE